MTEYLAENARLRQLSRRYAEGELPFDEYRAARREIIASLEAGELLAAPPAGEPAAVTAPAVAPLADDEGVFLKTMPPQVAEDAALAAAATAAPPAAWDGHTRVLAVVLGMSFLLALGALVYVFAL